MASTASQKEGQPIDRFRKITATRNIPKTAKSKARRVTSKELSGCGATSSWLGGIDVETIALRGATASTASSPLAYPTRLISHRNPAERNLVHHQSEIG
jgi:hypothetical protein